MDHDWDPAKNAANLRKHGIDFRGARTIWGGMSARSTGRSRDRTDLKRLDAMTEQEVEQRAVRDEDGLLLEDCDMASLEVVLPGAKEAISLRVDADVLQYFRSQGPGYQTRINAVLRAYVRAQERA